MKRSSAFGSAMLPLVLVLFHAPSRGAQASRPAAAGTTEHAYFGLGCFWSAESAYEGIPGVKSVTSGYTGGSEKNPTYEQVSLGTTGHFEAVDVAFDPAKISYARLLDTFWHNIDPMQSSGQFCDHGKHYRSAIFYRDSTQRREALASRRTLEASGELKSPIVTLILPAGAFWPAEEYHQDFWRRNPDHYGRYRVGCGRDRRLAQIWGDRAAKPVAH